MEHHLANEEQTASAWNRCFGLWRLLVRRMLMTRMQPKTRPRRLQGVDNSSRICSSSCSQIIKSVNSIQEPYIRPSQLSIRVLTFFLPPSPVRVLTNIDYYRMSWGNFSLPNWTVHLWERVEGFKMAQNGNFERLLKTLILYARLLTF